jgi:hypothetical protein
MFYWHTSPLDQGSFPLSFWLQFGGWIGQHIDMGFCNDIRDETLVVVTSVIVIARFRSAHQNAGAIISASVTVNFRISMYTGLQPAKSAARFRPMDWDAADREDLF